MPLMSLMQARWVAPAAWAVNVMAQLYGMLIANPNMKQVAESYEGQSPFTPLSIMIAIFFTPQQVVQAGWLARLWTKQPSEVDEVAIDYSPIFVVGNLCIAAWQVFWCQKAFKMSNVFVIINSIAQLYYMTVRLPKYGARHERDLWTTVNNITFAGIGVLDLLHNSGVAYFANTQPNLLVKVITPVGFVAASAVSDSIFSGCLAFDALALCLGQRSLNRQWSNILGATFLATSAVTVAKVFQEGRGSSSGTHQALPTEGSH